jgi:hypothetical protein
LEKAEISWRMASNENINEEIFARQRKEEIIS